MQLMSKQSSEEAREVKRCRTGRDRIALFFLFFSFAYQRCKRVPWAQLYSSVRILLLYSFCLSRLCLSGGLQLACLGNIGLGRTR